MMKKIVSLIAILVLSIGSFFAFFSLKNSEEVAYAESYNVLPDIFVSASNRRNGAVYTSIPIKFSPNNLVDFTSNSFSFVGQAFYGDVTFEPEPSEFFSRSFSFDYDTWIILSFDDYYDNFFTLQFYCDSNFVFSNIVKVECYGLPQSDTHPRNVIRFFDGNSRVFRLDFWSFFLVNNEEFSSLLFQREPRTLYTAPVDSSTTTWQEAYQNGYDNGVVSGQSSGYSAGYDVGYSAGDAVGYQRGVDASNQYSFGNLLFAVVDTPVVIFRSLFDFNVLGVNLQGFFFSLLTVAVVIAVVRFILAR